MFAWLGRLAKGIIIALGFILPGVSGGVLASILGLYQKMIAFLAHPTRDFLKNILFFLPLGIGGILGIALFSAPLEWLLANHQVPTLWAFTGSIVGTLPTLWQEATVEGRRDNKDWTILIITFIVSGLLLFFLNDLVGTIPASFASFILAGALIALGILVPGLSPSNLLLIMGLYSPMLTGFKQLNLAGVFLPIAIGGAVTMILFSKVMDHALENHHSRVYHFILGLVTSSTLLIILPNPRSAESISYAGAGLGTFIFSVILFVAGIALGVWMSRLEGKYKK
ncbi:DUF368 domain-containing protein [Streptococcus pluranimalium]|uniref:DUF368 domain-containing protein n=1 Tax=Streptococcus pluranimalium TaxID=82348 RepID=UPI00292F9C6C|nr:DUF368 domain-containing protein [Streptococcus pluranimalium]